MIAVETRGDWNSLLEGDARSRIEREVLPAFLPVQRWFAAKSRSLVSTGIVATIRLEPPGWPGWLVVAQAVDDRGIEDRYLIPMALVRPGEPEELPAIAILAEVQSSEGTALLIDGVRSEAVGRSLLGLIAAEGSLPVIDGGGAVRGDRTASFGEIEAGPTSHEPIRFAGFDQSNSSIRFGDRWVLKVFRKLAPGINPDYEIGRFLSEGGQFANIARTAGALILGDGSEASWVLGVLQEWVPSEGTAWDQALESLRAYYRELSARPDLLPPAASSDGSLLGLTHAAPPPVLARLLGEYLHNAALLGRRTAELHIALADGSGRPGFEPEPLKKADLERLGRATRSQVDEALSRLRGAASRLDPPSEALAHELLGGREVLVGILTGLEGLDPGCTKIRVHGDYHLGQVLVRTDGDFAILDFEGEPARSLEERRARSSPLKDVVGMLRSFDYAATAGLIAFAEESPGALASLMPWAAAWSAWVGATYLRNYLATADGQSFLPKDRAAMEGLLRAYLVEKATYELLYELDNRPDWVRIPLSGLAGLVAARSDFSGSDDNED